MRTRTTLIDLLDHRVASVKLLSSSSPPNDELTITEPARTANLQPHLTLASSLVRILPSTRPIDRQQLRGSSSQGEIEVREGLEKSSASGDVAMPQQAGTGGSIVYAQIKNERP